ncbi:hypothetical protein OEZ85_011037 [Tetradesmus obliquus]|uniref:DNA polymerase n=1 Tax=Tetradesmus obliquus TaxID=3088 RepID=A0ABY8TP28_TETOB|nr:hypothetical protein OEZ85_011037 [Tetradesmus obliquus]
MAASLEFQVLTYDGRDVERQGFDSAKNEVFETREYVVDAYGRTAEGRSVCVHVTFPPFCFISVHEKDQTKINALWTTLRQALGRELKGTITPTYVMRKRFYGFTNGWVRCSAPKEPRERCTVCDIEASCSFNAMDPLPERTSNTPLVVASYDIECVSESGGFPDALQAGCPIIQIATTFWRVTDPEPYKRYLACLGTPLPIEGVDIDACETEQQLLMAWAKTLRQEQVDILIGYNTFGFDNKYVFDRAALKGALGTRAVVTTGGGLQPPPPAILNFPYLMAGKRTDHLSEIHVRRLESSAYGQNEFYVHSTPGVLQIDLLAVIKKEYKLTSYKLDAVSAHFLGDNKVDLPIKEMFALYKQGTPEALQKIASYCVKDTELPIRLMRKLSILPNMMEMAKAVHVPIDYLIFRGQQIKVFSVILKKARENGFVCPTKPLVAKSEKYTGATVLEAKTGAHFGYIACLDFASLYPSIIRAHNMCHSTVVLDHARYGRLHEHINYETHDLGNGQTVTFAVSYKDSGEPMPSLLPMLLADLAEYRKEARKLQKQAREQGDDFLEAMYNGKQLAYKVTMNSLYGFCGAANGLLPCVPIAAAVTTVGRNMIDKTRNLVEQYYGHLGASVVYGDTDSVMCDFKVGDLREAFRLGEEAARRITSEFRHPIELEFEKIQSPFLLYSKKRYASLKFTDPNEPGKVDAKGISLVRRDSCGLVRDVTKQALDLILIHKDTQAACAVIHDAAKRLLAGQVPLEELVMSKALRGTYKAGILQPHDVVRGKIAARSPGEEPRAGDRVPFVYCESCEDPNQSVTCRAEDPKHVEETGMLVDYLHYYHLLQSALGDTIDVLKPELNAAFTDTGEGEYKAKRTQRQLHCHNARTGQHEITSFFSATKKQQDPFVEENIAQ